MSKYLLRSAMAFTLAAVALAFTIPAQAEDKKPDKPKHHVFTGVIDAIDAKAGTLTVKKKDESKTFSCAADAKFATATKKEAALADFKVGDKVTVSYSEEGTKLIAHKVMTPKEKPAN
jgi:Cu/Ag efflux protein CusF